VDDLTQFVLPLQAGPHFLIAGNTRTGKSTLLRTWAQSLIQGQEPGLRLYVIDSQRQSLANLRNLPQIAGYSSGNQATAELLDAIDADIQRLPAAGSGPAIAPESRPESVRAVVVLVDDFGDNYDETLGEGGRDRLTNLMRLGRGRRFHLLLAGRTSDITSKSYGDPIKSLKEVQVGFMLGSGDDVVFNTRLPYTERSKLLPVGEGYYVNRTYVRRVKIAVGDEELQEVEAREYAAGMRDS
jgi:S-DNA-T family DNA segregation ATPase FtsK/SpoIIIE